MSPKSGSVASTMPPKKRAGVADIDTPTKAQVARPYQMQGGAATYGAATATATAFGMQGRSAAYRVKLYETPTAARTATGPLLALALPRSRRRAARCVRPHRRALNARPAALRGASDRTAAL